MQVRPFHPSDTAALVTLFRDTVHRVNIRDYTPEQVEAWAPAEIDPSAWARRLERCFTFVAARGEQVVGFCNLEANGHIDCLYTHADNQGMGVGTALLGEVEAKGRELGLERLFTEASITARPFFESKGFQVLQQQEVECRGAWFVNFQMQKRL